MRLLPRHSGLRPQFYILTLTAGPCTLSGVLHGAFSSCTYYAREEVDVQIVFTDFFSTFGSFTNNFKHYKHFLLRFQSYNRYTRPLMFIIF